METRQQTIEQIAGIEAEIHGFANNQEAIQMFKEGIKWSDENPLGQWVSVEDHMPEMHDYGGGNVESHTVLVAIDNLEIVWMARYCQRVEDWVTAFDGSHIGKRGHKVTHWMTIPSLP